MIDLVAPALTFGLTRVYLRCDAPMALPRWKGALLRGGLGHALRATFCDPVCQADAAACPNPTSCPYATIFAPEDHTAAATLGGMHNITRPYVIRPSHEPKTSYQPGDLLPFEVLLIGSAQRHLPHIVAAFQILGQQGLGRDRGRATLLRAESIDLLHGTTTPVYEDSIWFNQTTSVAAADVAAIGLTLPATLRLNISTPMRLKHQRQWATVPECHILVRAALRRVSQLAAVYGDAAWDVPFKVLIEQAEAVPMREVHTHWVDWSRTSSTRQQHMTLGGLVGSVVYNDVPPALRAVLLLGSIVHVGKAVVFGHGQYTVEAG